MLPGHCYTIIMELPKTNNDFLDFDYAVWPAGTKITLTNVPWDSNYRDIVRFKDPDAARAYVGRDGYSTAIEHVTYCPANKPVRIGIPFSIANMYNYVMVENPAQPIQGDKPTVFYYFIHDVRYVSPNTTELDVQLDAWQTYNFSIRPGKAYVERGHIGIAADDAMHEGGRTYLTAPEGFDTGGEYMVPYTYWKSVAEYGNGAYDQDRMEEFWIIISSSISLQLNPGSLEKPKIYTARGWAIFNAPTGMEYYAVEPASWSNFLDGVSSYPWVAQGIQSITLIPKQILPKGCLAQMKLFGKSDLINGRTGKGGIFHVYNTYPFTMYNELTDTRKTNNPDDYFRNCIMGIIESLDDKPGAIGYSANRDLYTDTWADTGAYQMVSHGKGRYRYLFKFLTFPYSCIELTMLTGTPVQYRPENISGHRLRFLYMFTCAEPSPKFMVGLGGYNAFYRVNDYGSINDPDVHYDSSDTFDRMTGMANVAHYSVPSDMSLLAQAQNAHSIAYSRQSADWSQQRALNSAQVAKDNAQRSIASAWTQSEIGRGAQQRSTDIANQQAITGAIGNGVMNAAGSLLGGNIAGAVMGAASTAFNTGLNNQTRDMQTANSLAASRSSSAVQRQTAMSNVDANYNLAMNTIHGDYANTIAGINAKIQDSELVPPGVLGQAGGENLVSAAFGWRVYVRYKTLSRNTMKAIGEYWLRYGYAMNVWISLPENFQCMTKFTYWKLQDFRITSSVCPELYRNAIRGIFERGTTVWNDPNELGVIDTATNEPVPGFNFGKYN
nr:MAG TPA: Major tail protein [Caudoviricetes sp.]